MLYASSKGAMKKELENTVEIEAKDKSDLEYDLLYDIALKSIKK